MLVHYLKIALRNLSRNKVFSLINILGLAVGMGVCLLIYQYVHFEMSYDRFHNNAQNTYRITQATFINGEAASSGGIRTTHALGVRAEENIPEIEQFVRIHPLYDDATVTNPEVNEPFIEGQLLFVDSNFLQVFDFPLTLGDKESALTGKHNIVISKQMASKYFGANNPIGKTLNINSIQVDKEFIVSGVLGALPLTSHLQFDFLLPIENILDLKQYMEDGGWGYGNFSTYVTTEGAANLDELAKKLDQVITKYAGELLAPFNIELRTGFQPLVDIHLRSDYAFDFAKNNGSIQNVRFFSMIAVFILLMAWVNYINLSTAQAMHRAKEVGVRKSIGAVRKQLISQFMTESVLTNVTASVLSIGIAYLMLPVLSQIIGKEIGFSVLQNIEFWGWFAGAIIFGSTLSGLYPAFVLSSFKPVSVLKSVTITQKRGFGLRKGLIVFQFLTSILLISGTYLVYKQITFMKSRELGVEMGQILVSNTPPSLNVGGENFASKMQTFKTMVTDHHSISTMADSGSVPGKGGNWGTLIRKLGTQHSANKSGNIVFVDTDFTNAYDLHFLAGSPFTEDISNMKGRVIINEEAVKTFGFDSLEDAIHEKLVIEPADTVEIFGVIKNVHWNSLKDGHSPYLFMLDTESSLYFSYKMNLSNIQETLAHIEDSYHSVFPNDPFDYFFLDDSFNRQYQSDLQFGKLFTAFSILAIFIACLGLFALVSFSATLKTKEIGVRKVLGASVGNLMLLLSREYLLLLLIAVVLAIPMVVFGAGSWLENYAYRIDIGLDLLIIPALILFLIALMTVSYRTYVAANANPVDSLKTE